MVIKDRHRLIVGCALLILMLVILFIAAANARAGEVGTTIIPKRDKQRSEKPLDVCSPYTDYGTPCIWQGGLRIPIASSGPNPLLLTAVIVLPPLNPGWNLYRADFDLTVDFVYQNDCKNNLFTCKSETWFFRDDNVCK